MTLAPAQAGWRLRLHVLASGSKGNASIIEDTLTGQCVAIDCGISWKAFRERCGACGVDPASVSAVLVTHEHTDHTKGLGVMTRGLARLGSAPVVYASEAVRGASPELQAIQDAVDLRRFSAGDTLALGDVRAYAFRTSHDAAESFGFRFECADDGPACGGANAGKGDRSAGDVHAGGTCIGGSASNVGQKGGASGAGYAGARSSADDAIGFMTDTGVVTGEALEALQHCHVLAIEANHDLDMLSGGPYPAFLKARIAGERGHLSNVQSGELLARLLDNRLERVVGMHVSQTNNDYRLPKNALASVISQNDHPAQAFVGFQDRPISI